LDTKDAWPSKFATDNTITAMQLSRQSFRCAWILYHIFAFPPTDEQLHSGKPLQI